MKERINELTDALIRLAIDEESNTLSQSYEWMKQANELRPNDIYVNEKINEYEETLGLSSELKIIEQPFIVWTMRRTGGTSFMTLLTSLSKCRTIQHEPFNYDRRFGDITRKFDKGECVKKDLNLLLQERINIKHSYEIMPHGLNQLIFDVTKELGYKHIFLYRKNQVSRILSLSISLVTDVWGESQASRYNPFLMGYKEVQQLNYLDLKDRMKFDRERTELIYHMIANKSTIEFERLYFNLPSMQFAYLERCLACLGFNGSYSYSIVNQMIGCLYKNKTPTTKVKHLFKNYEEIQLLLNDDVSPYSFVE